ncbi:GMC oxidoreductase [Paenibacillus alkaliterrae]|uniref:GMC oxidoreductase n=1 Tax=Paenibacillus alkaliterrae TaxID=320909 RepID=UPI001F2237D8|nr:GMC oxidoreductase [Paenibacillus alkaliterrae]MCF2938871.1 GMC oxidoreductase [Paenibacillus alkaliterrae]
MRIYLAHDGDTLRTISQKYDIAIEDLLSWNPVIAYPDLNVAGMQIRFPSSPPGSSTLPNEPFCDIPAPLGPGQYLDQWIPLTPLEKMAQTDYDVIIVGTGPGGGAVLWRLCEQWRKSGKRIAIVEAGDLVLPTNAQNVPTLNGDRLYRFMRNPKLWKPIAAAKPSGTGDLSLSASAQHYFENYIGLGGRSIFWNAVTPRMHPLDIAQWPVSSAEMDRYYTIAEQIMTISQDYSKNSSFSEILLNRLLSNGFPETVPQPLAADMQPTKYGYIRSNVFFSSMAFFAWALSFGSFDLAVKARVTKVLADNGKAVGVKVITRDKQTYDLKGKTVVLSASTFETPRILLYSGIPGRAIGHYLTTHSRVNGIGTIQTADFPETLGVLALLIPRTAEHEYQIQIGASYFDYLYELKPMLEQANLGYGASGVVESRYENYVALNPLRVDEYGVPELEVQFSYSAKDKEVIRRMGEGIKRAMAASQATLTSVCTLATGLVYHDMGTCRMGYDPAASVTDPYGQVHGVQGLYVADNSVIPTSGAANPTLTTVALAIRTADYLMKQLR